MTVKLRREAERLQVREPRWENPELREEEDAEVEGRVRRKETAGEKREDLEGRTLEEEMSVVVEEAKDAMDTTRLISLSV